VFWVISVYFSIRNTLPKSGTFLLGHPVYGKITLLLMLKKYDGTAQIAFIGLRIEKWQTLANTTVKLLVLQNLGSFLTNCENNSFLKGTLLNGVIIL